MIHLECNNFYVSLETADLDYHRAGLVPQTQWFKKGLSCQADPLMGSHILPSIERLNPKLLLLCILNSYLSC